MLDSKNLWKYAGIIGVLAVVGLVGGVARKKIETMEDDAQYEMVKKYLLNDSPLYGYNKPKLWIHTAYEINARKWFDFYSKNSTDLNMAYIHVCIKSIIDHCGDDFHICLISDESFNKLLPTWDMDLRFMAEPARTQYREIALAELVYYYGGVVIPNSFLCLNTLFPLYETAVNQNKVFVAERVNRSCNTSSAGPRSKFEPNAYIMGAPKNNFAVLDYIKGLKQLAQRGGGGHFNEVATFTGSKNQWWDEQITAKRALLIDGTLVGVKQTNNKPILIEDLFEESPLLLNPDCFGIYIDQHEILHRTKYQWFAYLERDQIFEGHSILVQYMKSALIDAYKHAESVLSSAIYI
jgi:hypothetical protein